VTLALLFWTALLGASVVYALLCVGEFVCERYVPRA
jgi:hypothetical protein